MFHRYPLFLQPVLELRDGVGIFEVRDGLHAFHQRRPRTFIERDGLRDERAVDLDATVVDLLIERVFFPEKCWHGESAELLLDGLFDFNIALVVRLECRPFFLRLPRQVARPHAVRFRRFAWNTEIADERFAFRHFLFVELQHRTDALERERQAERCAPDAGAAPACGIEVIADGVAERRIAAEFFRIHFVKPAGDTDALEARVVRPLEHGIADERVDDFVGKRLATGKVIDMHRPAVDAHAEEQNLEQRRFDVAIHARFREIDVAERFDVNG